MAGRLTVIAVASAARWPAGSPRSEPGCFDSRCRREQASRSSVRPCDARRCSTALRLGKTSTHGHHGRFVVGHSSAAAEGSRFAPRRRRSASCRGLFSPRERCQSLFRPLPTPRGSRPTRPSKPWRIPPWPWGKWLLRVWLRDVGPALRAASGDGRLLPSTDLTSIAGVLGAALTASTNTSFDGPCYQPLWSGDAPARKPAIGAASSHKGRRNVR